MAVVTLTTDFGTQDGYVAQMKGVLLRAGGAQLSLHDLTHAIGAQDVRAAALFAEAVYPRFPAGTVHMLVVDPGVGSARRPLVVEHREQLLVGPDNGIFSLLYDGTQVVREIRVDPSDRPIAPTFHGRDIFAPTAARLALGTPPEELGEVITDPVRLRLPVAQFSTPRVRGDVIHIDRFGNLITNLRVAELMRWSENRSVAISCDRAHIIPMCDHYAQVREGDLVAVCDSGGRLEVAVRNGSARRKLDAEIGTPVYVHRAVART